MNNKSSRGFTLIELLVVIAIIGILSAVVLASLNTARSKGSDAAMKSNLNTVQTQASIYLSDHDNNYGTFSVGTCPAIGDASFFGDSNVANAIAAAVVNSAGGDAQCAAEPTAYAVSVTRPTEIASSTSSNFWCVDSAGAHCGVADHITGPVCGPCLSEQ